jgi:hypothetical protein
MKAYLKWRNEVIDVDRVENEVVARFEEEDCFFTIMVKHTLVFTPLLPPHWSM